AATARGEERRERGGDEEANRRPSADMEDRCHEPFSMTANRQKTSSPTETTPRRGTRAGAPTTKTTSQAVAPAGAGPITKRSMRKRYEGDRTTAEQPSRARTPRAGTRSRTTLSRPRTT